MTSKIERLWQKLEQQRIDLFQELAQKDPSVLNQKPTPETWSAHQNLEHLLSAEKSSFAYLTKKLSSGTSGIPKAGFKSWGRRFILRVAFALPTLKFKAPLALGELPETSELTDLSTRFANQRAEIKRFLDTLPDNALESAVWKHPAAGKMSILQMVDFFGDHFYRHEKQLKRALKQF